LALPTLRTFYHLPNRVSFSGSPSFGPPRV
jgi:hypothetical protein